MRPPLAPRPSFLFSLPLVAAPPPLHPPSSHPSNPLLSTKPSKPYPLPKPCPLPPAPPSLGSFHKLILQHEAFKSGNVDTGFIPKYADELTTPPKESKTKAFMTEVAKARKGTKK